MDNNEVGFSLPTPIPNFRLNKRFAVLPKDVLALQYFSRQDSSEICEAAIKVAFYLLLMA